jgi:cytochrome c oxidase cbb3-type subunit 4
MDINTLRTVLTLACLAAFLGIVVWAYSGARRDRFDAAARIPLDDGDTPADRRSRERGER